MSAADPDPDGTLAAQARLQTLFRAFDRLTPDELARIGYRPAADEEREALLAAVDEAAERTGRTALVDEARSLTWAMVLRRFGDGTLHPTWLALNWGLSSGTAEDRVAIAEILADAAAATVVEDALEPGVAEALRLDADDILGLAGGVVSEGALGRALAEPADRDLGRSDGRHLVRVILAGVTLFVAGLAGLGAIGLVFGGVLSLLGGGGEAGAWLLAMGAASGVALVLLLAVNRRPHAGAGLEP